MSVFAKIRGRLLQKFVRDPAGYGRPIPVEVLDGEYRSGHWDHFFGFSELPRNLILAGAIRHCFPAAPAVLDVGCGSGRLATLLQHQPFSRYLGVDISPAGIERAVALALPGMEFRLGDYETWRPAERFDAIVFNECIGYARDPAATLQAFAAHLNPGGRFFLSHYRSGPYAAQWRRIAGVCEIVDATSVTDASGTKTWDIKILRPRT